MKFTPFALNLFVLSRLPSAFLSGVRVRALTDSSVEVSVKYRWINTNPFKSMYWATQGMAAELATGIVVMQSISHTGEPISMLVTQQTGAFLKKAIGRIVFHCDATPDLQRAIEKAIATGVGQKVSLTSEGYDEANDLVSRFVFEWSVKPKNQTSYSS